MFRLALLNWVAHFTLGYRTANPAYTADELAYQLQLTKSRLIITHSETCPVALQATRLAGLTQDRIVLIDPLFQSPYPNLSDLVNFGLKQQQMFAERRLKCGEAKTKLALLLFSSGTTGKPKVDLGNRLASHFSHAK